MSPRLLPFGDTAVLVDLSAETEPLSAVLAWHTDLLAHPEPGQREALAAAETVLVRFGSRSAALRALGTLANRTPRDAVSGSGRVVTVDTVYAGEDLTSVSRLLGLSPEAVIAAHTGRDWTAAFGGFAPGFTYLTGGDPSLSVPRRNSPRTLVPAGAVALAGDFSAVYPRSSPGGWQLIGSTDTPMWDLDREQPGLVAPGDIVRFRAVRERLVAAGLDGASFTRPADDAAQPALTVVSPGLFTTLQDTGRPGRGDLGVTTSGAADRPSATQANRLLGLPEDVPVLETLLSGLSLKAETTLAIALTGAVGEATITDSSEADSAPRAVPAPVREPFPLRPGQVLTLGSPRAGLRGYVGVRAPGSGGPGTARVLDHEPTLGSRATDTLSGLGPAPLRQGQALATAPLAAQDDAPSGRRATAVGHREEPATRLPEPGETVTLRVTRGPRADWFHGDVEALTRTGWNVSADADRVGVRLATGGEPLTRARTGELTSEGMVPGALQVPPDGHPVLFLADHPVTGGYPVIATVVDADVGRAAQLAPGTPVRFALVDAGRTRAARAEHNHQESS